MTLESPRGDNLYPVYRRPWYPVDILDIRLLYSVEVCGCFLAIFHIFFTLWPLFTDIWQIFRYTLQIFFWYSAEICQIFIWNLANLLLISVYYTSDIRRISWYLLYRFPARCYPLGKPANFSDRIWKVSAFFLMKHTPTTQPGLVGKVKGAGDRMSEVQHQGSSTNTHSFIGTISVV